MSVAVMLARYKMVDVEDTLFKEGFSEFEEEEKGDFKEEGFEKFKWVVKVDKIELPANIDANALSGAMDGAEDKEESSSSKDQQNPQNQIMNLGTSMLSSQFEMFRNVLERAIRRVSLKVQWKEGSQTKEVTVAGYFTDTRVIEAAAGGQLTLPKLDDKSGGSSSGGGTSGRGSPGGSGSSGGGRR
jgi:hypothetical protein